MCVDRKRDRAEDEAENEKHDADIAGVLADDAYDVDDAEIAEIAGGGSFGADGLLAPVCPHAVFQPCHDSCRSTKLRATWPHSGGRRHLELE